MATKPTMTADEKWLVSEFKCDPSKVDKDDQEGGKNRKNFLDVLAKFRNHWEKFETVCPKLEKIEDPDPEHKKLLATATKNLELARTAAKKADIRKAYAYSVVCDVTLRELAKDLMGPGPQMALITDHTRNYRVIAGAIMRGYTH